MLDRPDVKASNIKNIDIAQIECFFTVMKYGNITHAANALNLSQTTVSRIIMYIERSVGFPLFTREAKGVIPTKACKTLYEEWQIAYDMFFKGWSAAQDNLYSSDQLKIVEIIEVDNEKYLVPILERFEKLHPHVTLHINEVHTLDPFTIINGEYDLSIAPIFMCEELESDVLCRRDFLYAPVKIYMHEDCRLANHPFDISELKGETIILGRGKKLDAYTDHVIDQFQKWGFKPKNILFCDSITSMRMSVLRNLGILFVTDYFMFPASQNIVKLPLDSWMGTISFLWNKNNRSHLLSEFIDCAVQAMQDTHA